METENNVGGDALSDAEQAYFQTGGEAEVEIKDEGAAASEAEVETQQAETTEEVAEQVETPRDEKGKFVPHGALHQERERRKAVESELEGLKQFKAVMEDRWNTLLKAQQPQQEAKNDDTPPDPNEDVFAALKWTQDKLVQSQKAEQERQQAEQARQQETQAEQQIWNAWETDARSYVQENADFPNAAQWLSQFRDTQLQALGKVDTRFSDPKARNAQIEAELKQIVIAAKQQNMSSAQFIYELAQGYGYKPAEQPAQKHTELPGNLAKVAEAQNAARTIAANPGKGGNDPLSPEAIASMSDREFSAWMESPENARRFERMMGAG